MSTRQQPARRASLGAPSRSFVGRGRELEELQQALEEAETGRGGVVAVTGEAGIGKTRLLQEVSEAALARGSAVHAGRCWEEGGAPAYWPWIQVVRAAGGDLTEIAAVRAWPLRGQSQADPEGVRFGLFDAVTRFLLDRAAEQPLLDRSRGPACGGRGLVAPASLPRRGDRERADRGAVLVPRR